MIEYLYDVIRASSGQPIGITAKLTKEDKTPITTPCFLTFYGKDKEKLTSVEGNHLGEGVWQFELAAEVTEGLEGRHWYCIGNDGVSLCFKKPLYLM